MWYWLSNVISWHQLVEWKFVYDLNPWDQRDDLSRAVASSAIVNEIRCISTSLGANQQPLQPLDLVIKYGQKSKPKPSPEEDYYQRWMENKEHRKSKLREMGVIKVA